MIFSFLNFTAAFSAAIYKTYLKYVLFYFYYYYYDYLIIVIWKFFLLLSMYLLRRNGHQIRFVLCTFSSEVFFIYKYVKGEVNLMNYFYFTRNREYKGNCTFRREIYCLALTRMLWKKYLRYYILTDVRINKE